MTEHLKVGPIEQFCRLESRMCSSIDCEHLGRSCEAAGCDNRICKTHELYCSTCEQLYCADCYEAHQESCPGTQIDPHEHRVELDLTAESASQEKVAKAGGCQ